MTLYGHPRPEPPSDPENLPEPTPPETNLAKADLAERNTLVEKPGWGGLIRRFRRLGRGGGRTAVVVAGVVVIGLVVGIGTGALLAGGRQRAAGRAGAASAGAPASGAVGVEAPAVLGAVSGGKVPSADGVARVFGGRLDDVRLGDSVSASVVDVASGRAVYRRGDGAAVTPASVTKLATAVAVLTARGPGYRLETVAVAGSRPGEVVLVGGGDPTLTVGPNGTYPGAGRLDALAAQVRSALHGAAPTRVVVDSTLFGGGALGPGWDAGLTTDGSVAPITALMVDGGRTSPRYDDNRSAEPDLAAGQKFGQLLGLPASEVVRGTAPRGARRLGAVESPPVQDIVELMLRDSDNVLAEAMARQVALAAGAPATFAGAAGAVRATLVRLGLPAGQLDLHDGSGLSRLDRLSPAVLTGLLVLACRPDRPRLWPVHTGLPVAGYDGSLADRYRTGSARTAAGTLRAKTGTLSGVNTLAGLIVDADGRLLAFALMAEGTTDPTAAETALDQTAATLTTCGCG